jgi:uncharacterized protein YlxW (UPF0749 family)
MTLQSTQAVSQCAACCLQLSRELVDAQEKAERLQRELEQVKAKAKQATSTDTFAAPLAINAAQRLMQSRKDALLALTGVCKAGGGGGCTHRNQL